MLIIQKFGGSSLADLERLRRAAERSIRARLAGHEVVVVVSAMGEATDELLTLAHEIDPSPSPRELDALLSTGEQQSAALFAIMLESLGQSARSFAGWQAGILSDGPHGDSRIDWILPERITAALQGGRIAVVSGFQGVDARGDVTTLGRGGSDTTAVALAAALDAQRCEIYTDVDGIYTADPRLLPEARFLPEIDFRDMLCLARAGSQVLHDRSVQLAMTNDVEIHLLSSFGDGAGSVVHALSEEQRPDFAGLTRDADAGRITLVGKAADASALSTLVLLLAQAGIPVTDGSLSEGLVSLAVAPAQLMAAFRLIHETALA